MQAAEIKRTAKLYKSGAFIDIKAVQKSRVFEIRMTCIAAKINLVSRKSLIGIARPYVALLFRHKCNSLIHTMPYLSLERLLEYFRTGHSVSFSHRPQDDKVSLFNKRFTLT